MLDLQSLLQIFIASGTPVVIIAASLPGAAGTVQVMPLPDTSKAADSVRTDETPASAAPSESVVTDTTGAVPAAARQSGLRRTAAKPVVAQTPRERLRQDEQRHGQQSRRPEEWAQLLGMSGRELRRAVKASALSYDVEQFGRGHGAWLITTSALRGYFETVDAVERGGTPAPLWYASVRRRT